MKKVFYVLYISKRGWTLKDRVECDNLETLKKVIKGMELLGAHVTGVQIVTGKRYGMEITEYITV